MQELFILKFPPQKREVWEHVSYSHRHTLKASIWVKPPLLTSWRTSVNGLAWNTEMPRNPEHGMWSHPWIGEWGASPMASMLVMQVSLSTLPSTPFGVTQETWAFLGCDSFDLQRQLIALYFKIYSVATWIPALLFIESWILWRLRYSHHTSDRMITGLSRVMAGLACITSNLGFEGYHDNISVPEQLCFSSHCNLSHKALACCESWIVCSV